VFHRSRANAYQPPASRPTEKRARVARWRGEQSIWAANVVLLSTAAADRRKADAEASSS